MATGGARYWISGREDKAHKGAGVSAMCWLSGPSVLVAGDEDGKLGVWKVTGVRQAGEFRIEGPVVKQKTERDTAVAQQTYANEFTEAVSKHASAVLLAGSSAEDLRDMLAAGNTSELPASFDPGAASAPELVDAVLQLPNVRPIQPSNINVAEHADDGKVYFTVFGEDATAAVCMAFESSELLSAVGAKAGTGLIEQTLKCVAWNKAHTPRLRITSLCANAAGNVVYSASMDCTVKVWEVAAGGASLELRHTVVFDAPVFGISCSVGGGALAVGQQDHIVLLHNLTELPPSGEKIRGHEHVQEAAKLPDHIHTALAPRDIKDPHVYNVAYQVRCMSVAMAEDGSTVAGVFRIGDTSSCWAGLWNATDRSQMYLRRFDRVKRETAAALTPTNRVVVAFREPFVLSVHDGSSPVALLDSTGASVTAMAAHPSGEFALAATSSGAVRGVSIENDAFAPRHHAMSIPHVTSGAARATGESVAFGTADGTLVVLRTNKAHDVVDPTPIPWYSSVAAADAGEEDGLEGRFDTQRLATQEFPELTQFEQPITSQQLYLNRADTQVSQLSVDSVGTDGLSRGGTQGSDIFGDEPGAKRQKTQ
eukprot:TRINITY_DN7452_c0_g1_i2.p1 TRINITY_DN7452_c0_g1~~TRINITY_DN7452_c0_g1_i2.p1  ORF type:complete len:624 (+),score=171.05 TRINITY_DN7452_c0_g1_i2:90-1874(+)